MSYHVIDLQTTTRNIINFRPCYFSCFGLDPKQSDLIGFSIGFPYILVIACVVQFQNQNEENNTDEISFSKILIKKINVIWSKITCLGVQIY